MNSRQSGLVPFALSRTGTGRPRQRERRWVAGGVTWQSVVSPLSWQITGRDLVTALWQEKLARGRPVHQTSTRAGATTCPSKKRADLTARSLAARSSPWWVGELLVSAKSSAALEQDVRRTASRSCSHPAALILITPRAKTPVLGAHNATAVCRRNSRMRLASICLQ